MSRSLDKFAKAARSETGQKFHDIDAESARLRNLMRIGMLLETIVKELNYHNMKVKVPRRMI